MAAGRASEERSWWGKLLRQVLVIVVAVAVSVVLQNHVVQAFYIPSGSMRPTLVEGDRVLVSKLAYSDTLPDRGDVVVFGDPQGTTFYIKRVVGLPGDVVEVDRRGRAIVNGNMLDEPYVLSSNSRPYGPVTVEEGELLVLGDNRPRSNDSRFDLGPVPVERLVGEAEVVVWPLSHVRDLN